MSVDRRTLSKAGLPYVSTCAGEYLVRIGTGWYIASRIPSASEPILYVNYYRIVRMSPDPYRPSPVLEEMIYQPVDDRGNGNFVLSGVGSRCYLQIEYSAQAEYIDDYPIPCPKVRKGIQTRWNGYQGQWEKCLKTGWVRA